MKLKTLVICALVALAAFSSSCAKSGWERPEISLGEIKGNSTIELDMEGDTVSITLKATRDWKIDSIQSWTAFSKSSGLATSGYEEIIVKAPENPGYNRYAHLVIKAGPIKEYLTLRQEGPEGEDDGIKNATVAEVIAEANKSQCYRIVGTVSRFSSTYCSFDITDETGSIYVFSVTAETKTAYSSILKNGDMVTIEGYYEFYEAKSQDEIINASIVSHTPAN